MRARRVPGRGRLLVYAIAAWLFVAGVVAQIFLAGFGIFAADGDLARHRQFFVVLILLDLVLFGASAIGGTTLTDVNLAVGLGLLVILVGLLPGMREDASLAAALHPLGGSLLLAAALAVAFRVTRAAMVPLDRSSREEVGDVVEEEGGS